MNDHPYLKLLRCPACPGDTPLQLTQAHWVEERLESSQLDCANGKHRFKIQGFVWDFLSDANRSETLASESAAVPEVYDSIWSSHAAVPYAGRTEEYAEKFRALTAQSGDLRPYFANKRVLDAGCGQGRFSFLASELGASVVFSVDSSLEVIRRAVKNTGNPKNHLFLRADLNRLPIRSDTQFDYIFSIGVLHHTPDTLGTFDSVLKHLAPKGRVSVYLYGPGSLPRIQWPLRPLTTRLPRELLLNACNRLGFGYDLSHTPLINLKKVATALHNATRLDVLGIRNITYEGLVTPYLREHSLPEVDEWFRARGIQLQHGDERLIAATGTKSTLS